MSEIMKLADAYASGLENYARGDKYDIRLRDALQAEVEMLEADVDAKADIAQRCADAIRALQGATK